MKFFKRLKSKKGSIGGIDTVIFIFVAVLFIAFFIALAPVFVNKVALDMCANDLAREAEISGRVGIETTARLDTINAKRKLQFTATWDKVGKIQINTDATVVVSVQVDIGFYIFGNHPITLSSAATATSEVFWK